MENSSCRANAGDVGGLEQWDCADGRHRKRLGERRVSWVEVRKVSH